MLAQHPTKPWQHLEFVWSLSASSASKRAEVKCLCCKQIPTASQQQLNVVLYNKGVVLGNKVDALHNTFLSHVSHDSHQNTLSYPIGMAAVIFAISIIKDFCYFDKTDSEMEKEQESENFVVYMSQYKNHKTSQGQGETV